MFIKRQLDDFLKRRMFDGKIIMVYGPRQAGKTTAVEHFISEHLPAVKIATFNGDEPSDCELLSNASTERLRLLIGDRNVVFIDEAQKIPEIGLVLKRFHDQIKPVQVIASGSSSEELASRTEEPLTGRKYEFTLLPPSFSELSGAFSVVDETRQLERRLVFGSYPEVVTHPGDEQIRIREIAGSYLYKDVLKYEGIRRPELLDKLLRALAFQVGQEVAFAELGQMIGCDANTAEKYTDILCKAFIVFRVGSYARNLRNELRKSKKIYFWDLGVRNAILGDWRQMAARDPSEIGHLWENYFMAERAKWRLIHEPDTRAFFWRTAQRQEVDLVEEFAGGLRAFEIKWNPKKSHRPVSKVFTSAYPEASVNGVSPDNYFEFLT